METQHDGTTFGRRASASATPAEVRAVYDEWAATYDEDRAGPHGDDYPLPGFVADVVARLDDREADVLDAACGTGLVGAALARHGFTSVDGLDISPRMISRARSRGVYHDLGPADLSQRLPGAPDKFGVVTCVDALEPGHLPTSAVAEFARVVHRGGHLVLTASTASWPEVESHLRRLAARRTARLVEVTEAPLHPSSGTAHVVAVLEVVASSAPVGGPGW
ncbi:class I SAM-dependent DNA methyltransferase [Actinomycetospora termitidis]|uniref:Class I SAM-dependent methyltransferase n=1 Tax=Actinomycetospora termitidis TaxID=3053470 RepID=A0ABT7MB80_9PSEU|nr:class I SAM-dependent methyltransferase [Actinomycetospora sp. Odt1-22]MDL5157925.1 class I SAM-dependent methyltransferase [Actinomycetospora sp. Odt1-22]